MYRVTRKQETFITAQEQDVTTRIIRKWIIITSQYNNLRIDNYSLASLSRTVVISCNCLVNCMVFGGGREFISHEMCVLIYTIKFIGDFS